MRWIQCPRWWPWVSRAWLEHAVDFAENVQRECDAARAEVARLEAEVERANARLVEVADDANPTKAEKHELTRAYVHIVKELVAFKAELKNAKRVEASDA